MQNKREVKEQKRRDKAGSWPPLKECPGYTLCSSGTLFNVVFESVDSVTVYLYESLLP